MTSALIVLPVPESPANSAVIPVPASAARAHPPRAEHELAVAGPIGQPAQAGDRRRRQHEVVPPDGRLDAPGEALEAGRVLLAGAAADVGGLDRAGLEIGDRRRRGAPPGGSAPAPRRYGAVTSAASKSSDVVIARSASSQIRARASPASCGASTMYGGRWAQLGSQPRWPVSSSGTGSGGQALDGRDVGLGEHVDRTGHERAAAQPGLAHGGVEDLVGVRRRRDPHEVDGDERHARPRARRRRRGASPSTRGRGGRRRRRRR